MERLEVISAIGTIGTADDETGNGATNEAAAKAARKANAKRFVLVSASKDSSAKPCGGSWKMLEDHRRSAPVTPVVLSPSLRFELMDYSKKSPKACIL